LRILQIIDKYHSGGGKERFLYDLTQKLVKQENETAILCLEYTDTSAWGEKLDCYISTFDNENCWRNYIKIYNPDIILWHVGPNTTFEINEIVKNYSVYAIVHNVTCPSGTRLFRDRDEICKCPTSNKCMLNWYVRKCGINKSPLEALNLYSKSKAIHEVLNQTKGIYVATEAMKQTLVIEKVNPEKIKLFDITLGNVSDIGPIKNRNKKNITNILYVGRLSYNKGVQYLIDAVAKIRKMNIEVKCNIVGGGWYEEELKKIVEKHKLNKHINFIGSVQGVEVSKYYSEADMVVVPSIWYEAAGLVVPEARNSGKPVIVFDSGGLPEWGKMMNNIYVTKRLDSSSLAHTIVKVKDNLHIESIENRFESPYKDLLFHLREEY